MSSEIPIGFAEAPIRLSPDEAARLLSEHIAANPEGGDAALPESDSDLEGGGQPAAPAHSGSVNPLSAPGNPFDLSRNQEPPPLHGGNSGGESTPSNFAGGPSGSSQLQAGNGATPPNPIASSGGASQGAHQARVAVPAVPTNQSNVAVLAQHSDGVRSASALAQPSLISLMSAMTLANVIGGKIPNFNPDVWIREAISGAALIEMVQPNLLSKFLVETALIESKFARDRVEKLLHELVAIDTLLSSNIKDSWSKAKEFSASSTLGAVTPALHQNHSSPMSNGFTPTSLFHTPQGNFQAPSHSSGAATGGDPRQGHPPSFMREIASRSDFSFDDSALFSSERTHSLARAAVTAVPHAVAIPGIANTIGQAPTMLHITLNQPSAKPPNYPILCNASVPEEFYNWLRTVRKESLNCQPVDRRMLNQLVSQEVQQEIGRIIVESRSRDPYLFDGHDLEYPTHWAAVSDKLLLRVLFRLNGPLSAAEAKLRLKKLKFFFNDSTTLQSAFCNKLRKHCNKFKCDLADFAYTAYKWRAGEDLTHEMIIEAFTEGFSSTDMIKNAQGASVARCKNLPIVREIVREKKRFPLDDIINAILDHFEELDNAIRANRGIGYDVTPWVSQGKAKKRSFNQITTTSNEGANTNGTAGVNQVSAAQPRKVQRPPTNNPRCNNCGSKGHLCSERTCFLWGAPGALGADGKWIDGTPVAQQQLLGLGLGLSDCDWCTSKFTVSPLSRCLGLGLGLASDGASVQFALTQPQRQLAAVCDTVRGWCPSPSPPLEQVLRVTGSDGRGPPTPKSRAIAI